MYASFISKLVLWTLLNFATDKLTKTQGVLLTRESFDKSSPSRISTAKCLLSASRAFSSTEIIDIKSSSQFMSMPGMLDKV